MPHVIESMFSGLASELLVKGLSDREGDWEITMKKNEITHTMDRQDGRFDLLENCNCKVPHVEHIWYEQLCDVSYRCAGVEIDENGRNE